MCGASALVSELKNYLEKGFSISKAISERSRTRHLPSICSAVNSICKEKETELGMICGRLLRGAKELSPLDLSLPRLGAWGRIHAHVPYLCHVWLCCVPDCFCPRCGAEIPMESTAGSSGVGRQEGCSDHSQDYFGWKGCYFRALSQVQVIKQPPC